MNATFQTDLLLVGLWLLVTVLLGACQYVIQRAFLHLRRTHPNKWAELGEPHVLSANGAYYPARKFLWSDQCEALGDVHLLRLARASRKLGRIAAMLGIALVTTLLLGAIMHSR
jgi:hypothetical protein